MTRFSVCPDIRYNWMFGKSKYSVLLNVWCDRIFVAFGDSVGPDIWYGKLNEHVIPYG